MSNNKQIEKPLELPHQETIVGTNTIQTKPFDNQKIEIMSNNKQSSVEQLEFDLKLWFEIMKISFPTEIQNSINRYKAMHKEEMMEFALKFMMQDRPIVSFYNTVFENEQ